ncbi:DDE-type integrase/transposase/recombinase [Paraburkholderia sp. SIMBA_049]
MRTDELPSKGTTLRSSKYLINVIEQDHHHTKSPVNVMLGFNSFRNAAVTISGIELTHRILKDQFDLTNVCLKAKSRSAVVRLSVPPRSLAKWSAKPGYRRRQACPVPSCPTLQT